MIITRIEDAQFLLNAPEVCVDIETDTVDRDGFGKKRGLSYVADVTWVAFSVENQPPVVLHVDPNDVHTIDDRDARINFIRQVLMRPGITIVGHNIGFDLRSLGGHYGFTLPIDTEVWDTQSIALVLLMVANANQGLALEELESKYNLLSAYDLAFSKRMKPLREKLHEQDPVDVQRYVSLDVLATWRLYRLQQAIIASTDRLNDEPTYVTGAGGEPTLTTLVGAKFIASKSYAGLTGLVQWETRISRWCANVAIRGVRLDTEYAQKHLERMVVEYHSSVEKVVDAARGLFDNGVMEVIQMAADLDRMIREFRKNKRKISVGKFIFRQPGAFEDAKGSIKLTYDTLWRMYFGLVVRTNYEATHDVETYFNEHVYPYTIALEEAGKLPKKPKKAKQGDPGAVINPAWEEWVAAQDEAAKEPPQWVIMPPTPNLPPEPEVPPFEFEGWLAQFSPVVEYFERLGADDVPYRMRVLADWFRAYWNIDKEIDDDRLTNMGAFAPFFLFVVLGVPFPTDQEIYLKPELVTGKLKHLVDRASESDVEDGVSFRQRAHEMRAWSMAEKAVKFYEGAAHRKDDPAFVAFYRMQKNGARIVRSVELQKHATRDGRIHPVLARRAQTGRGSCGLPNLMNIPFIDRVTDEQVFTGYLLPDTDDQVLMSMDISNAENYFAALSFGDSALAEACTADDFHMAMTRIYWADEVARLTEIIRSGSPEEAQAARDRLKALRKASKSVTFGDAYGSGVNKTARQIGVSFEEAARIKEARNRRFAAMARGKKTRAAAADALYAAGVRPAYTVLWTGRRVFIDEIWKERDVWKDGAKETVRKRELKSYTVANYLQQGGVGELVWRAIVLMDEYLERAGFTSRVALQLHDEIVLSVPIVRAFDAARALAQIIAGVVPELDRMLATVPYTQFMAALDGSNVKKWGWRADREYPLDLNMYVNQYGVHELRPKEKEAPTWLIDKYPNDTKLEDLYWNQYQQLTHYRDLYADDLDMIRRITTVLRRLHKKLGLPEELAQPKQPYEALERLLESADPTLPILVPKPLKIAGHDYGTLGLAARMTVFQQGYLAGHLSWDLFKKYVIDRIQPIGQALPDTYRQQFVQWENFNYYGVDKPKGMP